MVLGHRTSSFWTFENGGRKHLGSEAMIISKIYQILRRDF